MSLASRRLAATVAAAALALLLAACGNDRVAEPADHNVADINFANAMIPHHRQAIEMADLARQRPAAAGVKALAERIKAVQGPQVTQMSGWLRKWSRPIPSQGPQTAGMMTDRDMSALSNATGAAFDRLFLRLMIEHHQTAIDMARVELRDGQNHAAKKLARSIEISQTAEIEQMKQLQAGK